MPEIALDRPLYYRNNRMFFDSEEEYNKFDAVMRHNPRWIVHEKEVNEDGTVWVYL
jgi:hypothetical protein